MNRFTKISLILASVATFTAVAPAQADVAGTVKRAQDEAAPKVDHSACARSFRDARCGTYQSKLLSAVAERAMASGKAVSTQEVGRRQLDVLIASIN